MIKWKTTSFSLNTIRVIKGGILQRNRIQNLPLRVECRGPHFELRVVWRHCIDSHHEKLRDWCSSLLRLVAIY
jgi:hypothetical protein